MSLPGIDTDAEGTVRLPYDAEPWYDPTTGKWYFGSPDAAPGHAYIVSAEFAMRWRDQHRMGTAEWYRECVEALDG